MLLLVLGILFEFLPFAIGVYLALFVLEKVGKKRPGTWKERLYLTLFMAVGLTALKLVVQALVLIYRSIV